MQKSATRGPLVWKQHIHTFLHCSVFRSQVNANSSYYVTFLKSITQLCTGTFRKVKENLGLWKLSWKNNNTKASDAFTRAEHEPHKDRFEKRCVTLSRDVLWAVRSVCIALFDWTGHRSHIWIRLTCCRGKHDRYSIFICNLELINTVSMHHTVKLSSASLACSYYCELVLYRLGRRLWAVQRRV